MGKQTHSEGVVQGCTKIDRSPETKGFGLMRPRVLELRGRVEEERGQTTPERIPDF
jgi:hypothetical protein